MSETSSKTIWSHELRVAELSQKKPTRFSFSPNGDQLTAIISNLDIVDLKKLRFEGEITTQGQADWVLNATLGATVIQTCIVNLDPVTTRIDQDVVTTFYAELAEPEEDSEEKMPDDENAERLSTSIDIGNIMVEALALYLPLYPRSKGADLSNAVFTEPGKQAMRDEDARPFAGLQALRDKLENKGD